MPHISSIASPRAWWPEVRESNAWLAIGLAFGAAIAVAGWLAPAHIVTNAYVETAAVFAPIMLGFMEIGGPMLDRSTWQMGWGRRPHRNWVRWALTLMLTASIAFTANVAAIPQQFRRTSFPGGELQLITIQVMFLAMMFALAVRNPRRLFDKAVAEREAHAQWRREHLEVHAKATG